MVRRATVETKRFGAQETQSRQDTAETNDRGEVAVPRRGKVGMGAISFPGDQRGGNMRDEGARTFREKPRGPDFRAR